MSDEVLEILRWIDDARERERVRPSIGTPGNPFVLIVPAWAEERAHQEGTTCQAAADALWPNLTIRVDVYGQPEGPFDQDTNARLGEACAAATLPPRRPPGDDPRAGHPIPSLYDSKGLLESLRGAWRRV